MKKTFGIVMLAGARDLLRAQPEAYAANLEKHFARHLQPFTQH